MSKSEKPHPWKQATNKHAWAMFRLGGQELRAAFYNGSNIAQPTEYGILGHPTPGEIADERQPDSSPTLNEEPEQSPLKQSLKEADARAQARVPEQTRDRNQDRDR